MGPSFSLVMSAPVRMQRYRSAPPVSPPAGGDRLSVGGRGVRSATGRLDILLSPASGGRLSRSSSSSSRLSVVHPPSTPASLGPGSARPPAVLLLPPWGLCSRLGAAYHPDRAPLCPRALHGLLGRNERLVHRPRVGSRPASSGRPLLDWVSGHRFLRLRVRRASRCPSPPAIHCQLRC
eukprot:3236810-Pyramimonas_sp.AAC.1